MTCEGNRTWDKASLECWSGSVLCWDVERTAGYIAKTAWLCFTLTLLVHSMCTQNFLDFDRKNVNLYLCCIATITKATKPYAPVLQEMINKVTPFLNHLLHQDVEEIADSLFCCCRFSLPVVCQHSLVTLWQCSCAHSLLMALVLAALPDLCLTFTMCLCSSLPMWIYSSHFLFLTLWNVREGSLPCARDATLPAL